MLTIYKYFKIKVHRLFLYKQRELFIFINLKKYKKYETKNCKKIK